MTVLPIIERELRAEGRNAFTYWLRTLGALMLLIVFAGMMLDAQGSAPGQGARLFGNLNTALFVSIWLLVPLLTADCLSRERREGTLGLLFLTPLTARAIVIGKGLIHSLRALTMVLACLPVLAIPLLLGGVTWREELMALLLDLSSILLALAAGLVASAYCRQWSRALFLGEVLAVIALFGFGVVLFLVVIAQVLIPSGNMFVWNEESLGEIFLGRAMVCTDIGGVWSEGIRFLSPAETRAWLRGVCEMFALAVIMLGLTVLWVASRLGRSRWEEPASARQLKWQRFLFAPCFWKTLFRSQMRRTLEQNPIGWLQQYSTAARMTQWGWCLFTVIAESVLAATMSWYHLEWPQYWLLLLLALSLAASAASSFRSERETGALELILVTPLSVPQIIFGRLRGLWRQFLPALGMLLAVLVLLIHTGLRDWDQWRWDAYRDRDLGVAALIASTFATLPLIGLHCSLARRGFLTAWLLTIAVSVVLPWLLSVILLLFGPFSFLVGYSSPQPRVTIGNLLILASGFQVGFALIAYARLNRTLRGRKFALAS